MTLEEQLKEEILNRYKSIREFSAMTGIPYSTVDSVLKRGIKNSGVGTVIKMFSYLDIDVESITTGNLTHRDFLNETKNPPSTAEATPGEKVSAIFDCLQSSLIKMGLIREGEDITDQQAEILIAVCRILDATFQQGQHGV